MFPYKKAKYDYSINSNYIYFKVFQVLALDHQRLHCKAETPIPRDGRDRTTLPILATLVQIIVN